MLKAIKLLTIVLGALIVAGLSVFGTIKFTNIKPLDVTVESSSSQIITAVERKEEIVLLSLGIQGLESQTSSAKMFNFDIPGSSKASYIKYFFYAKLGIDGRDVMIKETEENVFLISVPEFIFIGHDEVDFELLLENNGALSFATPNIDHVQMVNDVLSSNKKQEYIDLHKEVLISQTKSFYEALIHAVDPKSIVEFEFKLDK